MSYITWDIFAINIIKEVVFLIILNLYIHNFLLFNEFFLDFTQENRNRAYQLENGNLKGRNSFKFKKFSLLVGSHSSGKTLISDLLYDFFYFIETGNYKYIIKDIKNPKKTAVFCSEIVLKSSRGNKIETNLYRIRVKVSPKKEGEEYSNKNIQVGVNSSIVKKNETYQVKKGKHYLCGLAISHELNKIKRPVTKYYHVFDKDTAFNITTSKDQYEIVLGAFLKTLEPSIKSIKLSDFNNIIIENSEEKIQYSFENIENSYYSKQFLISKYLTDIIFALKESKGAFFYLDDVCASLNTDLELAFIRTLIKVINVPKNIQIIYTTKNTDVTDIELPRSSFMFLRRDLEKEDKNIVVTYGSEYKSTAGIKSPEGLASAIRQNKLKTKFNVSLIDDLIL